MRDDAELRARKVAEHWTEYAKDGADGEPALVIQWTHWGPCQDMVNRRITGSESRNLLGYIAGHIGETVPRALSVGCGSGTVERDALAQGVCEEAVGVDIARGALETARRLAGDLPVTYLRLDMESETLPQGFPLAMCVSTLHHINNLGPFLENVHTSLEEGGLLALYEYVGPSRFQWTPRQLRLADDIYGFLPPGYHFNNLPRQTIHCLARPEISGMVSGDPSEAVRSSEMIAVVDRYFERLDRREVGGAVLNLLLGGIVENFTTGDPLDSSFIALAMLLEETLTDAGLLSSDFTMEIYRRRAEPLGDSEDFVREAERSASISRQETAILESLDELAAAGLEHEALTGELDRLVGEHATRARELQVSLERNAAMKRGLVFRAARRARKLRRPASVPAASPDPVSGGSPVPESSALPAPLSASWRPRSALAWAVESYIRGASSGRASLWVQWLIATSGRSGRALLLGFEPGTAALCVASGLCESATLGRLDAGGAIVIEWPDAGDAGGPYDLVLWAFDEGEAAVSTLSIEALMADGASLVRLSTVPGAGSELAGSLGGALPEGWDIEARTGGGTPAQAGRTDPIAGFHVDASEWFPAGPLTSPSIFRPGGPGGRMERAVTALGVYVECVLARSGLLGPRLAVEVFQRGEATLPDGEAGPAAADLVVQQELELARIAKHVEGAREHTARLERIRDDSRAALAEADLALDRLRSEALILEKGRVLKYPRWMAFRLRAGRYGR